MLEQSALLRPHRTERVITAGRLLLALFLVVVIQLDEIGAGRHARLLASLSLGYLAYAAALALITWMRHSTARLVPITTHVIDLAVFSVLMHLTEGPTSPFFIYFVFATVCGALRWHGRGALITGTAALAAYGVLALAGAPVLLRDDDYDQARFITRSSQLTVITLLLAYFGTYQRRLQAEIASLAAWPRRLPADPPAAMRDVLASASAILRAPRMVLVWQEDEEPSLRLAVLDGGQVELTNVRPDEFGTLVATPFERSSFFCIDASLENPVVVHRVPGGFASRRGRPLAARLAERYRMTSVLALRLATEDVDGYLFGLDRTTLSTDDILAGDIVGRLVAGALEQQTLVLRLRDAAASQERLRLARDLHDGVLQSLTAVGLQVGRLQTVIARNPPEAERRVAELEEIVAGELRRLRLMLEELHPGRAALPDRDVASELRDLLARLERQWEVRIHDEIARDLPDMHAALVREIHRMTEEAVVNAVRHGGATEVAVQLRPAGEDGVRLTVSYRGRGFATFTGRHDLASLARLQVGPRTLRERVEALRGELVITTDETGATVEILVRARQDVSRPEV